MKQRLHNLTCGSNVKVLWKCKKCGHKWITRISERSRGKGCPCCSGRKVYIENCLATVNPELAKEWNYEKNGNLTPNDVTISSGKKVWWKCLKNPKHEWEATISNRTNGKGCPCCSGRKSCLENCLATVNPELAKEWNYEKNINLTPNDVTISSGKKVWWKCLKNSKHEWESRISNRTNGRGCPHCYNEKSKAKS